MTFRIARVQQQVKEGRREKEKKKKKRGKQPPKNYGAACVLGYIQLELPTLHEYSSEDQRLNQRSRGL